MDYKTLEIKDDDAVRVITLNRPKALNALNAELVTELTDALFKADQDKSISAIILTGSEKAFAAGADIKEMAEKTFTEVYVSEMFGELSRQFDACRTPVIAAVSGYALGGGCELAMMCDFILASETAKFGQPEVTIGAIPGIGGTQRLARFIGKSKAMEMCLTSRMMGAEEAERCGLVSRIIPANNLLEEAMETAKKISGFSQISVAMTKECVNQAYETTLTSGLVFERRVFHSVFATEDQKEGMDAFINKRQPSFKDQ